MRSSSNIWRWAVLTVCASVMPAVSLGVSNARAAVTYAVPSVNTQVLEDGTSFSVESCYFLTLKRPASFSLDWRNLNETAALRAVTRFVSSPKPVEAVASRDKAASHQTAADDEALDDAWSDDSGASEEDEMTAPKTDEILPPLPDMDDSRDVFGTPLPETTILSVVADWAARWLDGATTTAIAFSRQVRAVNLAVPLRGASLHASTSR
jgi:hypothetical protein